MIIVSTLWESVEWLKLMWLVCNITAVLCRRSSYILETVFLNHQGLGLGMVLTSAPCKNAALSRNPDGRK